MPIDPYMVLKRDNSKNSITSFFDKLYERDKDKKKLAQQAASFDMDKLVKQAQIDKLKRDAETPDYEALSMAGLYKMAQGGQASPQEMAAMKAMDQLRQTKLTVNPNTGLPMPAARSIFDVLGQKQQKQPVVSPQRMDNTLERLMGAGVAPVTTEQLEAPVESQGQVSTPDILDRLQGSEGIYIDENSPPQTTFDRMASEEDYGIPEPANPKQAQEAYKAKLDIAKQRAQAGTEPMKDTQAKSATFADRMQQSEDILRKYENTLTSVEQTAKGAVPIVGNLLTNEDYKLADQAKRNFVNAALRQESGAAIAQSEFENAEKQYFPQVGDTEKVIEQKRKNREAVINGMIRSAGPLYKAKSKQSGININAVEDELRKRGLID